MVDALQISHAGKIAQFSDPEKKALHRLSAQIKELYKSSASNAC